MSGLELEKLHVSSQIIEELTARLKQRERDFEKIRGFKDRVSSKERLRVQRMVDRGQEVMRIIHDDALSSRSVTPITN
jgi:hypothetical protein